MRKSYFPAVTQTMLRKIKINYFMEGYELKAEI